ncbi:hypothetical protein DMENIID0001_023760 [Sergentomyia squamirostris]
MKYLWFFLCVFLLFGETSASENMMDMLIIPESLNSTVLECVHYCLANPKMSNRIYKCYKTCVSVTSSEINNTVVKRNQLISANKNSYDIGLICRDDKSMRVMANITENKFPEVILLELTVYDGDIESYFLTNSPFGFLNGLKQNTIYRIHGFGYRGYMNKLSEVLQLNPTTFSTRKSHAQVKEVSGINVTNFKTIPGCKSCLSADVIWIPSEDNICFYRIAWYDTYDGDLNEIPLMIEPKILPFYQTTIENLTFEKEYKVAVRSFMKDNDQPKNDFNWITFYTPQCREMLHHPQDIKWYCSPLQPAEVVTALSRVSETKFNITVNWKKSPEPIPQYYAITVLNLDNKMPLSTMMNLDGNKTEAFFPGVEFTGAMYEVIVEAYYPNGKRSSTTVVKNIAISIDKIDNHHIFVLIITTCSFITISIVILTIIYKVCKSKRENIPRTLFVLRNPRISSNEDPTMNANVSLSADLKAQSLINDEYEIISDKVKIFDTKIGEGQFGIVRKAILVINGEITTVAAKELKGNSWEQKEKFIEEIKIMKSVPEHNNILRFVGHITNPTQNFLLFTEYCDKGSLLNYLRSEWNTYHSNQNFRTSSNIVENPCYIEEHLTWKSLLANALQVAEGMNFLNMQNVVHRDLAARNVLLNKDNVAKIADFGLSRDVYGDGMYVIRSNRPVPFKWMAIEALKLQDYSTHSDVWSYGVLLYEIVTLGCVPYPGIGNDNLLAYLDNGSRMEKPQCCPRWLYDIMMSCWEEKREMRPTFADLTRILTEKQQTIPDDELLDMDQIKIDTRLVRPN